MKTFPICMLDGGQAVNQFVIYDPTIDALTVTTLSPLDGYLLKSGGVVEAPIRALTSGPIESEAELITVQQTYDQILISIIENLPFPTQLRGGYDQEISGQIHIWDTPTPFDATVVPKEYVVQSAETFLPLSGGTLTAPLVLHSAVYSAYTALWDDDDVCIPKILVDDLMVTTKDDIVAKMFQNLVKLSGGSVHGDLSLSNASCFDPQDSNEVVSKAWIESYLGCVFGKIQAKGEIVVEQEITDPYATSLVGAGNAILSIDFAITRQSIGGGTCSGRDYPFTVIVEYIGEDGGLQEYTHNFYYNPWGSVVPPHTQVRQGWAHFEIDLLTVNPKPKGLQKVILRSSGFEWKTSIDNLTLKVCDDSDIGTGEVAVTQTLDHPVAKDLNCDTSLLLTFDMKVIRQQSDDRPLTVQVDYQSDSGPGSWIRNFFHGEGKSFGLNEKVDLDKWKHYEYDLSDVCPCMFAVDRITVKGEGFGYEAQIDNIKLEVRSEVEIPGANTPKMEMDKTPPQSVDIEANKPVIVSAEVKIDSEDPSSLAVPLSVQVDYTGQSGEDQTHIVNVSSQPFDAEYLNAKEKATNDTNCVGALYYSHPDCPGFNSAVGASAGTQFYSVGGLYWKPNRWIPDYEFGSYLDQELEIFDVNKELGTIGIDQISAGVAGLSSLSSFNSQLYPTSGFSGFGSTSSSAGVAGLSSLSSFGSVPTTTGWGSTSNSYNTFGATNPTPTVTLPSSVPAPPPVLPPQLAIPTVSEKVVDPGQWATIAEDLSTLPDPPAKINKVTVKSEGDNTQIQFDEVAVNVCESLSPEYEARTEAYEQSQDAEKVDPVTNEPQEEGFSYRTLHELLSEDQFGPDPSKESNWRYEEQYRYYTPEEQQERARQAADQAMRDAVALAYLPYKGGGSNSSTYKSPCTNHRLTERCSSNKHDCYNSIAITGKILVILDGGGPYSDFLEPHSVNMMDKLIKPFERIFAVEVGGTSNLASVATSGDHYPVSSSGIDGALAAIKSDIAAIEADPSNEYQSLTINLAIDNSDKAEGFYGASIDAKLKTFSDDVLDIDANTADSLCHGLDMVCWSYPYCFDFEDKGIVNVIGSISTEEFTRSGSGKTRDDNWRSSPAITEAAKLKASNVETAIFEDKLDSDPSCGGKYEEEWEPPPPPSLSSPQTSATIPSSPLVSNKGDYVDCNNVMDCPPPTPGDPIPPPDPAGCTATKLVDPMLGDPAQQVAEVTVTGADDVIDGSATISCDGTLTHTDTANITGVWDEVAGKITFTGTAAPSEYETIFNSVQYESGVAGACDIQFNMNPGLPEASTCTTSWSNKDPASCTATKLVDPEIGDPAQQIAEVVVAGSDEVVDGSAMVSCDGTLTHTDTANITGVWDAVAGKITFTGTALPSEYETIFNSVQFEPGAAESCDIQFNMNPGLPEASTCSVSFATSDVPPTYDSNCATDVEYLEGEPAVIPGGILMDPAEASKVIDNASVQASDGELQFTDTANITGTWDSGTKTMNLTGEATTVEYEAAMNSVTFSKDPA